MIGLPNSRPDRHNVAEGTSPGTTSRSATSTSAWFGDSMPAISPSANSTPRRSRSPPSGRPATPRRTSTATSARPSTTRPTSPEPTSRNSPNTARHRPPTRLRVAHESISPLLRPHRWPPPHVLGSPNMRNRSRAPASLGLPSAAALLLGLALGCPQTNSNPGHCFNAQGDLTCAERFGTEFALLRQPRSMIARASPTMGASPSRPRRSATAPADTSRS